MSDIALNLAGAPALPRPAVRPRPAIRPDGVYLILTCLAAPILLGDRLLKDPDTHWHVAVGRLIWESGRLPWTDPFSHTFAGQPWIAKEWLSQILLYGAFAGAGWRGVALLATVAIIGAFALLFGWLAARLRVLPALALTLSAFTLSLGHCLARPHVFVFPVLLLWTMGLLGAAERGGRPPWLLLPLMTLWANLHGSFTIGFAVAGLAGAEAVLAAGFAARREALHRIAAWALFGFAILAAACVTPYGIHAMLVTVTLVNGEAMGFISEWKPVGLDLEGGLAAGALLLALAVLVARPWRDAARLALVGLFGTMMLRHVRFMSLFALVAPVAVAGPLVRRFPWLAASAEERGPASRLVLAAIPLVALGLAALADPRPSAATTPDAMLAAAQARGLTGPVYNDYDFGGFLISRGVPTFIDGRSDQLFLGGFFTAVRQAIEAPEPAALGRLLDRHGVTWALVRPDGEEARHLDRLPGWRRLDADAVATLYGRT